MDEQSSDHLESCCIISIYSALFYFHFWTWVVDWYLGDGISQESPGELLENYLVHTNIARNDVYNGGGCGFCCLGRSGRFKVVV
jgi:hypothetical protein